MVVLLIVIVGAIISNLDILLPNLGSLVGITALFCAISLSVGFFVPRLFRVERRQAIASAFEIGIHNGTLSVVIALTIIESREMAAPAAVYSVLMFFIALLFGFTIARRGPKEPDAEMTAAKEPSVAG